MEEQILHLNYNRDFTSLSVGTDQGYSFHGIENLEKTHQIFVPSGVRLVERILSSNMAVLVNVTSPRKLSVINIDTLREVCYFFFSSSIIAVRVNKVNLVVWVEDKIYIHTIPSLKVMHIVDKIPCNPQGIGDLCGNPDISLLAFPASDTSGLVEVFDCHKKRAKFRIIAHTSPVVCMVFDTDGNLVATASEKGTLIRIFSTTKGTRLYEFRRGMLRNASIYSMVFSPDNNYFAVSSNTETVHIFKLPGDGVEQQQQRQQVEDQSWYYWMKSSLPTQITEIFSEERAFATIASPFQGTKRSALAFSKTSNNDDSNRSTKGVRILLSSFDGHLYIYNLNEEGGECPLLKQHAFIQQPVAPSRIKIVDSAANIGSYSPPSTASTLTESVSSYLPAVNQIPGIFSQLSYSLLQSTMNVFDKSDYDQKTETGSSGSGSNDNGRRSPDGRETGSGSTVHSDGAASSSVLSDVVEPPFIFGMGGDF